VLCTAWPVGVFPASAARDLLNRLEQLAAEKPVVGLERELEKAKVSIEWLEANSVEVTSGKTYLQARVFTAIFYNKSNDFGVFGYWRMATDIGVLVWNPCNYTVKRAKK